MPAHRADGSAIGGSDDTIEALLASTDYARAGNRERNVLVPLTFYGGELKKFILEVLSKRYTRWGLPTSLAEKIIETLTDHKNDPNRARQEVYNKVINFSSNEQWNLAYSEYKDREKYTSSYDQIDRLINDLPRGVIVDFGAGNNALGKIIAQKHPNIKVIGVDIIDRHEDSDLPNLSYMVQPNVWNIPVEDHSVDIITMNTVFHHIAKDLEPQIIEEIRRILKPDGKLILLEDTYSIILPVAVHSISTDYELNDRFLNLIHEYGERFADDFYSFLDWYGNLLVAGVEAMPLPYRFRSMERWKLFMESQGFHLTYWDYTGLPLKTFHKSGSGVLEFQIQSSPTQSFTKSHQKMSRVERTLDEEISRQMLMPHSDSRRSFGQRSFLPVPTGRERGLSIGFDHSGTNGRAVLLFIDQDGQEHILSEVEAKWEQIKMKPASEIFDFMAQKISLLMHKGEGEIKRRNIDISHIPLGYAFGFPTKQSDLTTAFSREKDRGNKGWDFPDLHTKNLKDWINGALDRQRLNNIRLAAIFNDTVATQLSTFTAMSDGRLLLARIAEIVGTGYNFSFVDSSTGEALNSESGLLNIPAELKQSEDQQYLDSELSSGGNKNPLYKLITGDSIPELVRLKMLNLLNEGKLFHEASNDIKEQIEIKLKRKNFIKTIDHVDTIFASRGDVNKVLEVLQSVFPEVSVGQEDAQLIYNIVYGVLYRSAQLVSYLTLKALDLTDPNKEHLMRDGILLPIDGSFFWSTVGYKEMVIEIIEEKRPDFKNKILVYDKEKVVGKLSDVIKPQHIIIVHVNNASARGAAMGALVVHNKDIGSNIAPAADSFDQAMQAKGGIDFDSNKMNLQLQNGGSAIKFYINPVLLQKLQDAPGFTPQIINIQPAVNVYSFLGIESDNNNLLVGNTI